MDYTNKKYGKITLRGYARAGGRGVGSYYWGECECGNKKQYLARFVAYGKIKSCGKCKDYRKLTRERISKNNANRAKMAKATGRALKEGVDWSLSPQQYYVVIQQLCMVCGEEDNINAERYDIAKGYTIDNCYPECKRCRQRRGKDNLVDYIAYCTDMANKFKNS